jgi:hypothetical protein
VHGDRYDYSATTYVDSKTHVKIICRVHGLFTQKPSHHLDGHQCYECGRDSAAKSNTVSPENFLERARTIHRGKYDYSMTKYTKMHDKVIIICPVHGEFYQTPTGHLGGKGCGKCARNIRLTNKEFVSRARKVHGDKYDYSNVEYLNNSLNVVIGCPLHGVFKQSPVHHLEGMGCPHCGRITTGEKKASTLDEFLDKARDIHGNRYDYSKVEYTRSNRNVTIICPEHGVFEKTPNNHLSGEGCQKCSGKYRRTAADFVADAQKIHGSKYDYSKSDYTNTKHKVLIICPEHGGFQQTPESHLAGAGCPKCAGLGQTTEDFIRRANQVHHNRYDYSKTEYVRMNDAMTIICPVHGSFTQTAGNHISGAGCQKCGGNYRMNTADFIERARDVHGDKYDYKESKNARSADKVIIICPVHGEFRQKPNSHLAGVGCPSCANYGINPHEPGILYYVRVDTHTHTFWKIGVTNRTVEERFLGSDLKKITTIETWPYTRLGDALIKEQEIIDQHIEHLYPGPDQPLATGGNTELFTRDVLSLDKTHH